MMNAHTTRVVIAFRIAILLIAGDVVHAQNTPVFAIRPADRDWLLYIEIRVPFRQSTTSYIFGEVVVHEGDRTTRINLRRTVGSATKYSGDTGRGPQPLLAALCRTEDFRVPASGWVTFWRSLDNRTRRDSSGHRLWDITDTTRFTLLLRRSSDDGILAVLDSVGTSAMLTPDAPDARYGSECRRELHSWQIVDVAPGTLAYLQIFPEWYGYDDSICPPGQPNGLPMNMLTPRMNFSARYDASGDFDGSDSLYQRLSAMRFAELLTVCDSLYAATGTVDAVSSSFDSKEQCAQFNARYHFIADTTPGGAIFYKVPPHPIIVTPRRNNVPHNDSVPPIRHQGDPLKP